MIVGDTTELSVRDTIELSGRDTVEWIVIWQLFWTCDMYGVVTKTNFSRTLFIQEWISFISGHQSIISLLWRRKNNKSSSLPNSWTQPPPLSTAHFAGRIFGKTVFNLENKSKLQGQRRYACPQGKYILSANSSCSSSFQPIDVSLVQRVPEHFCWWRNFSQKSKWPQSAWLRGSWVPSRG